jgi:uncharacterized membrane protein (GlpM family)
MDWMISTPGTVWFVTGFGRTGAGVSVVCFVASAGRWHPWIRSRACRFHLESFTITITKTRACEAFITKNTTQELIRNCDARWAMSCSPVWHECMRLTRRWWEVGEKPSYNFTTLATAVAVVVAWSLQQVSILSGGVEFGKGMLLIATCNTKASARIDILTRCVCFSLCGMLKFWVNLVCTRWLLNQNLRTVRTCRPCTIIWHYTIT